MKHFRAKYKEVVKAWNTEGDTTHRWILPLDQIILRACSNQRDHTDTAEVYAKVALVNRMYNAKLTHDKEWKVANAFVEGDGNGNADSILTPLYQLKGFNARTLVRIVTGHANLVRLVKQAIGVNANVFCSKYLSFHLPQTVPIFDSKSKETSEELIPSLAGDGEAEYEMHCRRILRLCNDLRREGIERPDLKAMDYILYFALRN
jgi:hypothetical protein